MRSLIGASLEELGQPVKLVEAESGFEALRRLPREDFDLVVTDINMPDINGLELVSFVKRNAGSMPRDSGSPSSRPKAPSAIATRASHSARMPISSSPSIPTSFGPSSATCSPRGRTRGRRRGGQAKGQ